MSSHTVFWRGGRVGERGKKSRREDSLCLDKNIMLISTDGMRNTEKVHDSLIGFWQNVLAFFFSFDCTCLWLQLCCNKDLNDCFILRV